MTDLEAVTAQLEKCEEEIQNPVPTPPVGTMVVFYQHGIVRENAEIAAVVTAINMPGNVTLSVFRPMGMVESKKGALHVNHPMQLSMDKEVRRNNGSWDYIVGTRVPSSHYDPHLKVLNEKKHGILLKVENAKAAAKKASPQAAKKVAS